MDVLSYLPLLAAGFAIPQFVPQIVRLRTTGDTAGLSWAWGALTSMNNAAWLTYFALSHYWTALVPSTSATTLASLLAVMLTMRLNVRPTSLLIVLCWAALLLTALAVGGRAGLGSLLAGAFVFQVTPSIWTAYRTRRPTGISRGTWTLVLAELSCWTTFGFYKSDPRLIVLGCTGVTASILMLARIRSIQSWPREELVPGTA
jgi:hypothetical protein